MNKEIYVPSALRHFKEEERKEAWGVGIQNRIGEFGMTDGPFATEKEALECIGSHKSRIIHFAPDSDDVAWYWRRNRWEKP